MICGYLLPFNRLPFHFFHSFLQFSEAFSFDVALFVYFWGFFGLVLEVRVTKTSLKPISGSLSPVFSSRSFMISDLISKCLIHFELTFVFDLFAYKVYVYVFI